MRALPFLLVFAACGVETVDLDPSFLQSLRFDCDPSTTDAPACPPFSCKVGPDGKVPAGGCSQGCDTDPQAVAHVLTFDFQGPTGTKLCVPSQCEVKAENTAPECRADCSDNDQTTFLFDYGCPMM